MLSITPQRRKESNHKEWYKTKKKELGRCPITAIRERNKKVVLHYCNNSCLVCGYNKTIHNLAFHHMHKKEYELNCGRFKFSLKKLIDEIEKCIPVCHNCHGEIHHELIDEKLVKQLYLNFKTKVSDLRNYKNWIDAVKNLGIDQLFGTLAKSKCEKCNVTYIPKKKSQKYCSHKCAEESKIKFDIDKNELLKLLKTNSMLAISKKYGISDRAVKKKIIKFGIIYPP